MAPASRNFGILTKGFGSTLIGCFMFWVENKINITLDNIPHGNIILLETQSNPTFDYS